MSLTTLPALHLLSVQQINHLPVAATLIKQIL